MKWINFTTSLFFSALCFSSIANDLTVQLDAAEQGDVNALVTLGVMYENGQGVTQDLQQAVNWYRKAAELGDVDAELYLGFMYEKGKGVTQDYKQAFKWFSKAADQENERAKLYLRGFILDKLHLDVANNHRLLNFSNLQVSR